MFSYNTVQHTSTKFTPYELLFGYKPELPSSVINSTFKYRYDDYVDELKVRLSNSHEIAWRHILESKEKNKEHYDKTAKRICFNEGDYVYLNSEQIKPGLSKKLAPRRTGPYKVVKNNSNVNCTIRVGNKNLLVHKNRLYLANSINQ